VNNARGFTLVEVLVALSVLSIAVVALVKVQGESAATASATRARLLAQIVAENRLVESIAAPAALDAGTTTGEVPLAGQVWTWTQDVAETGDRDITRIDISVRGASDDTVLATLAGFKGRGR
jgi:general secretion pathway protein I